MMTRKESTPVGSSKAERIANCAEELVRFYKDYRDIIEYVRETYPLELTSAGPVLAVPFRLWGPLSYATQRIARTYDALVGGQAPVNYYRDYFWVYSEEFGQEIPVSLMSDPPPRRLPVLVAHDVTETVETLEVVNG